MTETEKTFEASENPGGIREFGTVRNWMECIRSRQETHAPVEVGYYHSIANIMTNAAVRTGKKAVFNELTQEVMVDGKVFKY